MIIRFYVCAMIVLCILPSCKSVEINEGSLNTTQADRVIVGELGFRDMDMGSKIADIDNIEAVTEMASQITMCKIVSCDEINISDETRLLNFIYTVEIVKLYHDSGKLLKVGDKIQLSSSSGYILGNDYKELDGSSAHAQKFGYIKDEYAENEYYTSSLFDEVVLDIGKTYLLI